MVYSQDDKSLIQCYFTTTFLTELKNKFLNELKKTVIKYIEKL